MKFVDYFKKKINKTIDVVPRVGITEKCSASRVETPSFPLDAPAPGIVVVLASKATDLSMDRILFEAGGRSIVVISEEERSSWVTNGMPVRYHQAISLGQINWVVRLVGPVSLLMDMRSSGRSEDVKYWKKLFFHLRNGGEYRRYLSPDSELQSSDLLGAVSATYQSRLSGIESSSLALAIAGFEVTRKSLRVFKSGDHYVKHRHAEASRFLATRANGLVVTEIARIKGTVFETRARVTNHNQSVNINNIDETFSVPDLQLRHYQGKIGVISNSLIISDLDILPDSFKFPTAKFLNNVKLVNVSEDFAQIPSSLIPNKSIKGSFYHVDSSNSGHFGHLLGEVLACLWGWDKAKLLNPDLKLLFRIRFPNERIPSLEIALFRAYGILDTDIVWIDEPVWVENLIAAAPMWQNQIPHFVHPEIQGTWDRISDSLVDDSAPSYDKVFISRATNLSDRSCRNIREVEQFFARHDFTILCPETLSLPEQATIFRHARVVAGFGGSGLFNIIHARNLENLIVLNHEAYTARNEHLFSSVIGCQVDYFWSTPDIAHPVNGWSQQAYVSQWEFDFERNGTDLGNLLESFGSKSGS